MKKFVLLYDEIVIGVGLCKAGTTYNLVAENNKHLYTEFEIKNGNITEIIIHGFKKTHAVVVDN